MHRMKPYKPDLEPILEIEAKRIKNRAGWIWWEHETLDDVAHVNLQELNSRAWDTMLLQRTQIVSQEFEAEANAILQTLAAHFDVFENYLFSYRAFNGLWINLVEIARHQEAKGFLPKRSREEWARDMNLGAYNLKTAKENNQWEYDALLKEKRGRAPANETAEQR